MRTIMSYTKGASTFLDALFFKKISFDELDT